MKTAVRSYPIMPCLPNTKPPIERGRYIPNETVMLRWIGDGFTLTYHINKTNPDWRFLDTWYTYEVKDLYRMNQGSPLAESLFAYLCTRIDD